MSILTKLEDDEFNTILSHYNIGCHRSHKHAFWALGNTIYIIKTSKGKFVLKIFEKSDPDFIAYQIKLADVVARNKIPVPKIMLTKSKKKLLIWNDKRIMIQKFVEGRHHSILSNHLIIDIAHKQARFAKALSKVKLENKYDWGGDYHFKLLHFNVKRFGNFNIRKEENDILKNLRKIDRAKLRRSPVHGDFHMGNMILYKDKLKAIIYWDDAHEDYFIHDIVTFIAHSFLKIKTIECSKIKLYLKEYQKMLKLNDEEKKAIYYFIKQRYLSALSWKIKQIKNHKDLKDEIDKRLRDDVKKYTTFSKLTLDDFLRLY